MPKFHYDPPINDKREMVPRVDWAGWYEISILEKGVLVSRVRWWDGTHWNHGPNLKRGCATEDLGDVRGIVRLVPVSDP